MIEILLGFICGSLIAIVILLSIIATALEDMNTHRKILIKEIKNEIQEIVLKENRY